MPLCVDKLLFHCKLHFLSITRNARAALKSHYLFMVGAELFPANQNFKYECSSSIVLIKYPIFLPLVYVCIQIQSILSKTWWSHEMETFSALLALCVGNSPVTGEFPHKGQWRGALMFSLICAWLNDWVHNREAGDLKRHRAHYDVIRHTIACPRGWDIMPLLFKVYHAVCSTF